MPQQTKPPKWVFAIPFGLAALFLFVFMRPHVASLLPDSVRPFLWIPFVVLMVPLIVGIVLGAVRLVEGVTGKSILDEDEDGAKIKERQQRWHRGVRDALDWLRNRVPEPEGGDEAGPSPAQAPRTPAAAAGVPAAAVSPPPVAASTPQEDRFSRLAIKRKLLTREQIARCHEFQAAKRAQGSFIPLWDCSVLQNVLDQHSAEQLREEAGELAVDSVGEFMLVRKLGEGGMGSVWLATDPHDRSVALKVLSPERARQRPMLTRFFREGQAAIRLQHPNLVRGLELGEDGGHYFYAMEFVAGRTVRELLDEEGRIASAKAAGLVLQVTSALAYAHGQGIVHRDIKPGNIIVTPEGAAKLADLGLAKYVDADLTLLTHSGAGMGTPCYIAPEQIRDAKRADARSDIYSLGATWYHMVVGHPPFTGATTLEVCHKHVNEPLVPPSALRADVPEAVSRLIARMMDKDPANRVQTAEELERAIRETCPTAG